MIEIFGGVIKLLLIFGAVLLLIIIGSGSRYFLRFIVKRSFSTYMTDNPLVGRDGAIGHKSMPSLYQKA